MVRVTIYIEGGGTGNSLGRIFRRAWSDFFASAGFTGRKPAIKRGGSRNQTFASFAKAIREAGPDDLPILLVDSEGPVPPDHSPWQHLQANDGLRPSAGAGDDSAFLMAQAMEAWLLADPDALRSYFGREFNGNRLPGHTDPEQIPVNMLESSLRDASAGCGRKYAKGVVSFEILGIVNAVRVVERCRQAKALIDYLNSP